ncbi:helix-turn-helix domain-containing protein [Trinickia terrae]|uniref:helix-turn-helix domain-containing protein n=1 Tax=Trinickia terrae TaxID=2571161 RepID=UPI0019800D58|nr:helix-turn-helix transcriptional regulator [Trinickia terrae]
MNIAELLDAAKRKQGSLGSVAAQLGVSQSTLSNWRAIRSKPNATEVAMLAEMAELPIFETLAEVEKELNAGHRSVWDRALGNLRAAGLTAALALGIAAGLFAASPNTAHAADQWHTAFTRQGSLVRSQYYPPDFWPKTSETPLELVRPAHTASSKLLLA